MKSKRLLFEKEPSIKTLGIFRRGEKDIAIFFNSESFFLKEVKGPRFMISDKKIPVKSQKSGTFRSAF